MSFLCKRASVLVAAAFSVTVTSAAFAGETETRADNEIALDRAPSAAAPDSTEERYASPQWFALELRFAPYLPNVDDEPALNGRTPYKDSFGENARLLVGLELDVQPLKLKKWGTLGAGLGLNYASISRPTRVVKADGTPGAESSGETTLTVFPMYLAAVLRIDALRDQLKIPVSPYLKAGLAFARWEASNGGGTATASTSTNSRELSGKGGTWGTHFAAGLALDIGAFDKKAARGIDETTGINHTYVYGEWMFLGLTGLGATSALHLDASTWSAGLAFEF